jgi:hypothetical protein
VLPDRAAGGRPLRHDREDYAAAYPLLGGHQKLQPHRSEKRHLGQIDDQGGRIVRERTGDRLFERRSGGQIDIAADRKHNRSIAMHN